MKGIEFLYLSQSDVIDTGLTTGDAIAIIEEVLREHGLKHYENPPKPALHSDNTCSRPKSPRFALDRPSK